MMGGFVNLMDVVYGIGIIMMLLPDVAIGQSTLPR
jgi:hypothetical protein